jgi:hypothetical protein
MENQNRIVSLLIKREREALLKKIEDGHLQVKLASDDFSIRL